MIYDPQGQLDDEAENCAAMRQQLHDEADKFSIHFREFKKCDEREANNILIGLIQECYEAPKEQPKPQPSPCPLCSMVAACTCLDDLPF